MQATLENSDLSDCDSDESSDESSDQPIYKNFNEAQSSINRWDTLSSRAGVSWKRISDTVNRGRAAAENIFSQRSGPTSYSEKVSNQEVHSAHFVCLLISPCFVQFKTILSSMAKLMTNIFQRNFANWKKLLVFK